MAQTTLTFVGAAGTVTGSKFLLTVDSKKSSTEPRRLLIDAGLFQGERKLRRLNWADFPVPAESITDILLTHAHLDHTGYLPRLVKQGFRGRIWATPATIALSAIVLRDSAYLQERDAEHARRFGYSKHEKPIPLYRIEDVEDTLPLMQPIEFETAADLGDGIYARWTRAGHILGSASIRVTTSDGEVLFSGDLGRAAHSVLKSREIPHGAPTVLIESTYGDREHFSPDSEAHETFAQAIRDTADRGGSVLVPAFAVDRTEVVLKALSDLVAAKRIPELPIFVDSPMALDSLRLYRSRAYANELRDDVDNLSFKNLNITEVRTQEHSELLNRPTEPSIIISASGMLTGGRVLHHLEHMLPNRRHSVILTGYQSVGTRGRALLEGTTELKMYGAWVAVRAQIVRDEEFSVHADRSELISWLRELSPKARKVYCVHGERDAAAALGRSVGAELGIECEVSQAGMTIPIGSI